MARSFTRGVQTLLTTSKGALALDSTESVTPEYTSTLTSHQVESGSTESDHIVKNNPVLSITGTVSDARLRAVEGSLSQLEAKRFLEDAWSSRDAFQVSDFFQSRSGMYITSLRFPQTTDNFALNVEMTFEQIIFRSTTPTTTDITLKLEGENEKGTQPGEESQRTSSELLDFARDIGAVDG